MVQRAAAARRSLGDHREGGKRSTAESMVRCTRAVNMRLHHQTAYLGNTE